MNNLLCNEDYRNEHLREKTTKYSQTKTTVTGKLENYSKSEKKISNPVGILSLASRLGLGAGICISNILDTEWGQNLLCIPYI
jgi:hypothetical protein